MNNVLAVVMLTNNISTKPRPNNCTRSLILRKSAIGFMTIVESGFGLTNEASGFVLISKLSPS